MQTSTPVLRKRIESSRGLTLVELLVLLVGLVVFVGFLGAYLLQPGCTSTYKSQCANNLRQIGSMATLWAEGSGTKAYPIGPGNSPAAHESLNVLIEHDPLLPPKLFLCLSSEAIAADIEEEGEPYTLDPGTLSYAWVGKSTKLSVNRRPLSADKYVQDYKDDDGGVHDGHPDGLNALQTDGSVEFVPLEELEKYFPATMLPDGLVR